MIFIDAIAKNQSKTEEHGFLRLKSKKSLTKASIDTVDLSQEAFQSVEFDLLGSNTERLTAMMSIEALIIETFMQTLCNHAFPIHSLDELALRNNNWHIDIQSPPIVDTHKETIYNPQSKAKATDILIYKNTVILYSTSKKSYPITVICECSRRFSQENQWGQPTQEMLPKIDVQTPYSQYFLENLPKEWLFIADQDGEEDQLANMLQLSKQKHIRPPSQNAVFHRLRIWQERNDRLRLCILGTKELGGVFMGNVRPKINKTTIDPKNEPETPTTRPPNSLNLKA